MSGADLPPDHPDQLESLSPVTQAVMQWTPEDDPNGEPDSPTTDGEPDWPTDSFEAIRALPTVQAALVEHNREPEPERLFDTEIPQAKPGDSDLGPHEGAPLAATSPAGSPVPASPEKPAVSPPSEPQEFEVVTITVPPRAKPGDPITLKNGSRIKVPGTINGHTAAPGDRFKVKLPKAKPSPSVETGNPVNDPAENQPVNATPSDQTPSEMVQRRMAGSPGEVRTRVLGPPGTRSKPDWICKDGEADPEVAGQPRKEVTVSLDRPSD